MYIFPLLTLSAKGLGFTFLLDLFSVCALVTKYFCFLSAVLSKKKKKRNVVSKKVLFSYLSPSPLRQQINLSWQYSL